LEAEGKSPHTIAAYRRGVRHFVRWFPEAVDPAAVLPADVKDWKSHQQSVERSAPATINQRLVALSRFFSWAVSEKIAPSDPTVTVSSIRLEKRRPSGISDMALRALRRKVRGGGEWRDIAIIEMLVGTGLRVSELLDLRVGDIKLKPRSGSVTVRQGKGGGYRTLPLTRRVREALREYMDAYSIPETPSGAFWMRTQGLHKPLEHPSSVARILDKYAIQAKLPRITPHQLRHTFAMRYLEKNPDDLRGLAALLGHSDLNTVMIYTEPTFDDLARRMEKTEGLADD
jgi:site-specific recombinase XerD